AGFDAANKKAGARPAFSEFKFAYSASSSRSSVLNSVLGDDRATPTETIVQANLDGVLVVAETTSESAGVVEHVDVAEVIVLVLDLARPVLGEQVFEASTDSVA